MDTHRLHHPDSAVPPPLPPLALPPPLRPSPPRRTLSHYQPSTVLLPTFTRPPLAILLKTSPSPSPRLRLNLNQQRDTRPTYSLGRVRLCSLNCLPDRGTAVGVGRWWTLRVGWVLHSLQLSNRKGRERELRLLQPQRRWLRRCNPSPLRRRVWEVIMVRAECRVKPRSWRVNSKGGRRVGVITRRGSWGA